MMYLHWKAGYTKYYNKTTKYAKIERDVTYVYISSVLFTVALLIKVHPGTLVTVKGEPVWPAVPHCKCLLAILISYWTLDPLFLPSMSKYWRFKFFTQLFLEVQNQNTGYSTLSISLWALEILALSLGVFSPTSWAKSFIFSLKLSFAPSGGRSVDSFFSCFSCSILWRGSL